MSKDLQMIIITLVTGGIIYGIVGFGYMHGTFASKDITTSIVNRLDRIEDKLDRLMEKK